MFQYLSTCSVTTVPCVFLNRHTFFSSEKMIMWHVCTKASCTYTVTKQTQREALSLNKLRPKRVPSRAAMCSLSPPPSEDGCSFTVGCVYVFSLYDSVVPNVCDSTAARVGSTVRCVSLLYLLREILHLFFIANKGKPVHVESPPGVLLQPITSFCLQNHSRSL